MLLYITSAESRPPYLLLPSAVLNLPSAIILPSAVLSSAVILPSAVLRPCAWGGRGGRAPQFIASAQNDEPVPISRRT